MGCCEFSRVRQLFVPVNGIPVPRLFHLAGAAVPFLVSTALDDRQDLFQHLGIFVSGIKGKVYEIRHTGMYTGMADDLTSGVHQVAVTQLVDLLVQIAQCFGCCIKGFRFGMGNVPAWVVCP